jgi:hypothetical protein
MDMNRNAVVSIRESLLACLNSLELIEANGDRITTYERLQEIISTLEYTAWKTKTELLQMREPRVVMSDDE